MQLPIETTPPQRIDAPPEIIVPEGPKPTAPPSLPSVKDLPERTPKGRKNGAKPPQQQETTTPAQPAGPVGPPAAETAPAPAPAPLPQLAPMMSDEQRRAYDTAIDASIGHTQQDIARARGRSLSAEQKEIIERAQAFIEQAKQIRAQDPAAAKSLAERAELLSKDVVGR